MAMTPEYEPKESAENVAPLARYFLWADSPKSVHKLIIGLSIMCAFLFLMDFVWHRHTKVPGEGLYGFHAIAGFVSFTLVVLGARALRVFIRRDETFYGEHGVDSEEYPEQGTQRLSHEQRQNDNLSSFGAEFLGRVDTDSASSQEPKS
ncbi:MAG: hypothetical protein ACI9UN_004277 [Granulosicoccus sp.]|jgi:hypothetical protein